MGLRVPVLRAATISQEIPALGRIPSPQSAGRLESQTGARPRYRRPRKGWLLTGTDACPEKQPRERYRPPAVPAGGLFIVQ